MAETHELRLKIDSTAAKRGSREFTAAVNAVKQAVRDLERDSTGAFAKLRKGAKPQFDVTPIKSARAETEKLGNASDRATERIRTLAVQSSNALRVSTDQASRLRDRLLSVGDTAGLAQIERALVSLKASLTNATTGLDVREARAGYASLASELNRTAREAERLRAETIASANAQETAANAAARRAASLETLRAKHDSLFATSRAYEQSLAEVQQLEDAGVLSAQRAATAREQAAASLIAVSNAADVYSGKARVSGHETAYMAAQFNDIGVMLASGQSPLILAVQQGTQISQMLNQMGDRASILATLRSGFMSMINPVSLATIGIIAGGAALTQWAMSALDAGEETKSFEDRLSDLSTAVSTYRGYADAASQTTSELSAKFGVFGAQAGSVNAALATIGRLDAIRAADAAVDDLTKRFGGLSRTTLTYADAVVPQIEATFLNLKKSLALTDVQAATVVKSLEGLATADTMQEKVAAANSLNEAFVSVFGSVEAIPDELLNVQREALLVALQVAEIGNETDKAADKISRMHEGYARSRVEAQKATASAQELLTGLRQQAEVNKLIATYGKDSVQVAEARIRAERAAFAETTKTLNVSESMKTELMDAWEAANGVASANMTGTISSASQAAATLARNLGIAVEAAASLNNARASKEYGGRGQDPRAFGDGGRLSGENYQAKQGYKPVSDLISQLTKSSGGGSRNVALSEEQRAIEDLNKSLKDRLTNLQAEKLELELVASGQFQTVEAARLMAEAQASMGSSVDKTTEALIRQIDAAQKSANEMRNAANSGAAGWMNAVPSYKEAADKIQTDVLDSLSSEIASFAKTGEFNFERLADSILSTMIQLAAKLAVKELFGGLLGGGEGGGGGILSSLLGAAVGSLAEGGYSTDAPAQTVAPISAFRHAPHFAEGGLTSGIPAVLHPNEAVIPLSKGRKIPVDLGGTNGAAGGTVINQPQTFNITTPDADSFRKSQKQIQNDAFRAGQRAAASNS